MTASSFAHTVRRAEAGEGQQLHELAAATFGLACPPGTMQADIDLHIAANLSRDLFETYLADPDRVILVATADGVFAGYTMLVYGEPKDADVAAAVSARPVAELSKCYVLPGAHGSGVASDLMMATIETARLSGARCLWLGVNDQNGRANRFYAKHGFEIVGAKRFLLGTDWQSDFTRVLAL